MSTTWTQERARVAALSRDRAEDDPELINARRNLKALRAEQYVAQLVADAPPLTSDQRHRIAALLAPEAVMAVA